MASTTETAATKPAPRHRPMPMVVYFESDFAARQALAENTRHLKHTFESGEAQKNGADAVLVTTSERLVGENYDHLRAGNMRLVALADEPFQDARLHGAVYAYLPVSVPRAFLERMIDNALDHIHLLATREEANQRLAGAVREIHYLNQIGAALSAEHDTEKVLELILTKSRELTQSDAGSLYVVEEEEEEEPADKTGFDDTGKLVVRRSKEPKKVLRFMLTQNDTVSLPFKSFTLPVSDKSISGYVALTGEAVHIEDAYHLPAGVPYGFGRKFDEDSGYRTKSILTVPMKNQKGEVVGVIQLINAKRRAEAKLSSVAAVKAEVVPYNARQQELMVSLASQAAVAYENSQLYASIQRLFEGFVRASVTAIEARDPTTSGHSFRVANLTVALAEAADRCETAPFTEVRFSRQEMKEIRYASLLHDFGKVGVREEVLVKAKKLYPEQLKLVKQRFQFVKRTLEQEHLKSRIDYVLQKGREEYLKAMPQLDAELARQLEELDLYLKLVLESNEPTVLPAGSFERLLDLAAREFEDYDGNRFTLLNEDEVRLLSIRKGSLDDAERRQIESHVVHTYNFLQKIPWTKEIRNIPMIARGHHEKLNGKGYPANLAAQEIPIQTRMMTVSDIFDALAASDRPYKKAVPPERALEILGYAVKDGEIDPAIFGLFLEARVFDKWKIEPYPY
jgi:HD-GYP domain-containing protein (c-di-GMP phosphodiesterase class II)